VGGSIPSLPTVLSRPLGGQCPAARPVLHAVEFARAKYSNLRGVRANSVHQGIARVEGVERTIAEVGSSQHLRNPTAHIGSKAPVRISSAAKSFWRPSPEFLIRASGVAVPVPMPANV